MVSGQSQLKKREEVLGGYDPSRYASERLWATARDGVRVPISIVYPKGFVRDGRAHLVEVRGALADEALVHQPGRDDVGQHAVEERHVGAGEHLQMDVGQRGQPAVAHSPAMGHPEAGHLAEIGQRLEPFVGDGRRALDVQLGELAQAGQLLETNVAECRAAEPERDEVFQAGQVRKARVMPHPLPGCVGAQLSLYIFIAPWMRL